MSQLVMRLLAKNREEKLAHLAIPYPKLSDEGIKYLSKLTELNDIEIRGRHHTGAALKLLVRPLEGPGEG